MSKFQEKIDKFNDGLKYYTVQPISEAMQEDGNYGGQGYGIINNETLVVEHSTICLPAALFQAVHFDDMLSSQLDTKPELTAVPTGEAVLPN